MTNRLGVEHRRRLEELAQEKGEAISDVARRLIDGAMRTSCARGARRRLNVEDPPGPDTLMPQMQHTEQRITAWVGSTVLDERFDIPLRDLQCLEKLGLL